MRKVLIADPNTAFATVVGEALHNLGAYEVALAASGPEAQQKCLALRPDLAVVDVDLPDCRPGDLIRQMRDVAPGLPVVFIPYSLEEVPAGLDIQGLLTKPFFLPDLPALIDSILGPPPEAQPEAEAPPPRPARPVVINDQNRPQIEARIEALSRAVRNEPVLLTRGESVISASPGVSEAAALAEVVAKAWQAGGTGALGEVIRFEGDSETTRYMLYSFAVAGGLVLSLALRVRLPLPTVRKLGREAATELAALVTAG